MTTHTHEITVDQAIAESGRAHIYLAEAYCAFLRCAERFDAEVSIVQQDGCTIRLIARGDFVSQAFSKALEREFEADGWRFPHPLA